MRSLVALGGVIAGLMACGGGATEPVFNTYPRALDLGPATWTDEALDLRWFQVGVLNSSYFPIDVRGLEVRGDGEPYLEARLRGGASQVTLERRESTVVEVRIKAPLDEGVGGWATGDLEATLRFEVGGSPKVDPSTGESDPAGYVTVETLVPVTFRLECDRDGDGFDHAGCSGGTDCDDLFAAISPDAVERCDGIDNDCDEAIDEDDVDGCVDEP